MRRTQRTAGILLVLAACLPEAGTAETRGPRLLAPAAGSEVMSIQNRCPTFHWSGLEDGVAYDLVLYGALPGAEPVERYRVELPGDIRSWTPAGDKCLQAGGRYAWSVRALFENGSESWSEVGVFEVANGPSIDEVEKALQVLRRFTRRNSELASEPGEDAATRPPSRPYPRATPNEEDKVRITGRPAAQTLAVGVEAARAPTAKVSPALAPVLSSTPSLVLDDQIHLGTLSTVYKAGDTFLWDDAAGGNLGVGRGALPNPSAGGNTAVGEFSLAVNTVGANNTGVGFQALRVNQSGDSNTAIGWNALSNNRAGSSNTAVGSEALLAQNSVTENLASGNTAVGAQALKSVFEGSDNTAIGLRALELSETGDFNVSVGSKSLQNNTSGNGNVAVGNRALANTSEGAFNVAIGSSAGVLLGSEGATGNESDNIYIANQGRASDNEIIRIGNLRHDETYLAGQLALGFDDSAPEAQLTVRASRDGLGDVESNNVVWLENTDTAGGGDVLALKIGEESPLESDNNFITFLDGNNHSLGAIEGNGIGGVTTASSGADYAEFLERVDPDQELGAGDVVGLFGNRISATTSGAHRVMVISTAPIVLGNDPGEEHRDGYERVAFIGQAPVRTMGSVESGDVLIASGSNDGTATARSIEHLRTSDLPLVLGRALEKSSEEGEKRIRAMVGVPDPSLAASLLRSRDREIAELRSEVTKLGQRLVALEAGYSLSPNAPRLAGGDL